MDKEYWKFLISSLLVIAAVWAFSLPSPIFYNQDKSKISGFNDFVLYYGTATTVHDGDGDKMYDKDLQQQNLSRVTGVPVKKLIVFPYPPQSMLFLAPLAGFSPAVAYFIWQIISIIATLLLITSLYFAGIFTKKNNSLLITAILIVTFYPWVLGIRQGQVVILMTLGILGYHLLARHKHFALAGMLIVLTAFKPPMVIGPVLYLLIIHGKRLWYSTILASIAILAICPFIFGFSIWSSYIEVLFTASGVSDELANNLSIMGNLRSLLFLLLGSQYFSEINLISSILWIISIVATICLSISLRNESQKMQELGFSLAIAIDCFFCPWMHIYSFLYLVIPIGYLAKHINFNPHYMYIGGLIDFSILAMFIDGMAQKLNPAIWAPPQVFLILFIIYHILQEKKKSPSRADLKQKLAAEEVY